MALAGRAALAPHGRDDDDAALLAVQHIRERRADRVRKQAGVSGGAAVEDGITFVMHGKASFCATPRPMPDIGLRGSATGYAICRRL